jgi:hypothetical protein
LRELHRNREDLHRAEKALTLRIKAKCRRLCGGDKTEADALYKSMRNGQQHPLTAHALAACQPFFIARDTLEAERKATEKAMAKQVKTLPVYPWAKATMGFGDLGLAQIVGECGDLSIYSNPAKVWKRMGLAVIGGERQRRVTGADAIEHGYSPSRRSIIWNIGDSMIKCSASEYRALYLERKETEKAKAEAEGLTVVPAAKIPAKTKDAYRSEGHVHARAKRYMEKRLLRNLWRAWRDC